VSSGQDFYYSEIPAKSQWLKPVVPGIRPELRKPGVSGTVLSAPYVVYVDPVTRDSRHGVFVVDVAVDATPASILTNNSDVHATAAHALHVGHSRDAVDAPGGPVGESHKVVLEKVPLTELDIIGDTPLKTLAVMRAYVRKAATTTELIRRAFTSYGDRPCLGQELHQGARDFAWTSYVGARRECVRQRQRQRKRKRKRIGSPRIALTYGK
jgi:hypothetical protein